MKPTTIYHLQDFWNRAKDEPKLKKLEKFIKGGAIIKWNGCRVYNPLLFYLFQQSQIKVRTKQGNEVEAETQPFIEYYCAGYKEGRQQFRANYPNPQQVVNDIKAVYENRLKNIPNNTPISIPIDKMFDFGFMAGELTAFNDMLEQYPESFKAFNKQPETTPKPKQIPTLPEIFKSKDYFNFVIDRLENDKYISKIRESGKYQWIGTKTSLAGLAIQLREKNRLENPESFNKFDIHNNQDLGKVFSDFFNLEYKAKTFQPDSIKPPHKKPFSFIIDF